MKKKWIFLICFIIALIIIVVGISVFFSKKKEKDRDYELLQVSELIYYPLEVQGKYGVIKNDGTVIVEPDYDEVQIPNQEKDIFILKKSNSYVVLNSNNEQIFTDFEKVTGISETTSTGEILYNTTVLKYKENGKYGLVDLDGTKITDAVYDEMTSLTDKYGEILVKEDGKYGVINVKGVTLVHTKYDYVKGDGYIDNGNYKNAGYIIGNKSDEGMVYGYIDKNENEVIKMEQESLYRVTEVASGDAYLVASINGRYALYKNKENLTGYKYINIYTTNETDFLIVQKNKSYGLINLNGDVVIPEEYEELLVVGIYIKAHKDDTDYTFDFSGNQVDNSQFVSLEETSTGKYYISIDENYKYGIADMDKNIIVENIYDYIEEVENTGLLIATASNDITIYSGNITEIVSVEEAQLKIVGDYIQVTTAEDSYFLTVNGKQVDNKTVYLDNEIYASKDNGKWGFVDLRDSIVVDYEYDEVTEVNEFGFAGIKKDGKWGVINKDGEIILEPTYESDLIDPTFLGKYYFENGVAKDSM